MLGIKTYRSFAYVTTADFLVRSAYQMGKTPLLPIFAAALGASGAFLGFIVSVSTLTGMVLKPFVGLLSDRWGRRIWLLLGTTFFVLVPFVYRFVDTPEQLFAVRILHGLATAIYGPVTLALVAELSPVSRAERLGFFSLARNAGYVMGPGVAGWLLLTMPPVSVFTMIGIISSVAYLPVLLLPEPDRVRQPDRPSLRSQALRALRAGVNTPAVWLAGGLEACFYLALYAIKTFLPLYALSVGISVATVGSFLSVQAAVHMVASPLGGRIADRLGHMVAIAAGMAIFGATLSLLPLIESNALLMAPAVLMGIAQALVTPSTTALVSNRVDQNNLGAGMGLVGMLRNAGKVAGPALAGLLIQWLAFGLTFLVMGIALLIGAIALWYRSAGGRRRGPATAAPGPVAVQAAPAASGPPPSRSRRVVPPRQ